MVRCWLNRDAPSWTIYTEFSVNEGFDLSNTCEKDLELKVPEILWLLLLKKRICMLFKHLSCS